MAWRAATTTDRIEEGEVLGLTLNGHDVALFRIGGKFHATGNVCTHEFALLSDGYVEGDCVECPLHQARFHIPTGQARSAPAMRPLATYPVKVEGDTVLIDLPA